MADKTADYKKRISRKRGKKRINVPSEFRIPSDPILEDNSYIVLTALSVLSFSAAPVGKEEDYPFLFE